ncbi:MAG: flagellar basal body rod protein FlgB [Alphaproteobacteria bacterium]|nr:flagellar basal body rod protein FlgB [Alphaproteobacteria bacterium]MCB9974077.1 flagellar basal body rod protein FlgB [Rhodospirillales bacterium]
MSGQDIALFKAIGAKLDYLSQRHKVIAENIANADTPGYRPRDLKPVDFGSILKGVSEEGAGNVRPATTDSRHLGSASGEPGAAGERDQKKVYEVAPVGNAVIIEEQLLSAGRNVMDYNLMLNVYQKQVGMMKIALGAR